MQRRDWQNADLKAIEVKVIVQNRVSGDRKNILIHLLGHAFLVTDSTGVEGFYRLVCIQVSAAYLQMQQLVYRM